MRRNKWFFLIFICCWLGIILLFSFYEDDRGEYDRDELYWEEVHAFVTDSPHENTQEKISETAELEEIASKAKSLSDEALRFHNEGNYKGAVNAYKRVLTLAPVVSPVWFNMALSLQEAGQAEIAKLAFQRVYDLNESLRLRIKNGDLAVVDFDSDFLSKMNHDSAESLLWIAYYESEEAKMTNDINKLDSPISKLELALRLEPSNYEVHRLLASLYDCCIVHYDEQYNTLPFSLEEAVSRAEVHSVSAEHFKE